MHQTLRLYAYQHVPRKTLRQKNSIEQRREKKLDGHRFCKSNAKNRRQILWQKTIIDDYLTTEMRKPSAKEVSTK